MRKLALAILLAASAGSLGAQQQWGTWTPGRGAFGDWHWASPLPDLTAINLLTGTPGECIAAMDTGTIYCWSGDSDAWIAAGGGSSGDTWKTINPSTGTDLVAGGESTLNITGGPGITVTSSGGDTITIASTVVDTDTDDQTAAQVTYDPTASGLTATDVQAAIDEVSAAAATPDAHASTHENGGADEISVAGLSGLLADAQTPLAHTQAASTITDFTAATQAVGDPRYSQRPATSTDERVARYDGVTGKLQDSGVRITDAGGVTIPSTGGLTVAGGAPTDLLGSVSMGSGAGSTIQVGNSAADNVFLGPDATLVAGVLNLSSIDTRIDYGPTSGLPATCSSGQVRVDTTINGLCSCTAANTWSCQSLITNYAGSASPGGAATSVLASGLPAPTATTFGGVQSITPTASNWLRSLGTDGVFTKSQPACADLSNAAASCSTDATNASNLASGTVPLGRLPTDWPLSTQTVTGNGTAGRCARFDASHHLIEASGDCAAGDTDTTISTPVSVANGGTGTGSTLTGLVRGNASAMTAAEISGDCTTSGSNAITCTKTSGSSFGPIATTASATDDTVPIGNGVTFDLKSIANCTDTGGNHLNYTASTNTISCGTSGDGTGGITGLGSVDNVLVRTDGTAGTAAQGSGIIIGDEASGIIPISVNSASASVGFSFTPKGTSGTVSTTLIATGGGDVTHPSLAIGATNYGFSFPGNGAGYVILANAAAVGWYQSNTYLPGAKYLYWDTGSTTPADGITTGLALSKAADSVLYIGTSSAAPRDAWVVNGTTCVVATDQTNATTTPQTWACYVTGSTALSLAAGKSYRGTCVGYVSDSTAADGASIDFDSSTATATTFRAASKLFSATVAENAYAQPTALATDIASGATLTGAASFEVDFFIKVNAAGTFQPRFFQSAHSAGTLTLAAGSNCKLDRLD